MMLRLQKFDLLVSYKKGTEMYLAHTLSTAFRMCRRTRQDTTEDVVCIEELRSNTERELEIVNMIQYLPVSEATQIAIKQATKFPCQSYWCSKLPSESTRSNLLARDE